MLSTLLSDPNLGLHFVMRWLHLFFGVIWIGLLYYFNFVQGAFMAETDAGAKSQVTQKLVPRALWWFRYGALYTFLTGVVMLMIRGHLDAKSGGGAAVFTSYYWINILSGGLLATLMFLNVWGIIWRKQKIVIANAVAVAGGGAPNPAAATAAAAAGLASRTNVLFSIPMLFFMLGSNHLGFAVTETSNVSLYWTLFILIVAAIQGNAMYGKMGPLTTIKGVVTCGFILTGLFVLLNAVTI
ncbi:MAG: urate hydroxylase PuuD [Bdellovibrionales bacterium]|nr:urate hydroxylase PuuD [Bdellovibrionales bacterium]